MANPENRFEQGHTESEWLDLYSDLVQFKVNKQDGEVSEDASDSRAVAEWINTVDDLMISALNNVQVQSFEYIDNTSSRAVIPLIQPGFSETIELAVTTERNMLELTWFSLSLFDPQLGGQNKFAVRISHRAVFSDLIFHDVFTQRPVGGDFTGESGFKGNSLIISEFARETFSPSPGVLSFFVTLTNLNQIDSTPVSFAYVVKAFDLTLTDFTPGGG